MKPQSHSVHDAKKCMNKWVVFCLIGLLSSGAQAASEAQELGSGNSATLNLAVTSQPEFARLIEEFHKPAATSAAQRTGRSKTVLADGGGDGSGAGPGSGSGGNFTDLQSAINELEKNNATKNNSSLSEIEQKKCLDRLRREYGMLVLNLENYSHFKNYKPRNLLAELNQDFSRPIFVFKEKLELALKGKDAVNYPYERVISFRDSFCQTISDQKSSSLSIQTLLFHELANMMRLKDQGPEYPLSSDFYLEMSNRANGYVNSDEFLLARSPRGAYAHALIRSLTDSEDSEEIRSAMFSTAIEMIPVIDLQRQSQVCFLSYPKGEQAKDQNLCQRKILETYKTLEVSLDLATRLVRDSCYAIPIGNVNSRLQCFRRGISALALPKLNNQLSACRQQQQVSSQLDCLIGFFDEL